MTFSANDWTMMGARCATTEIRPAFPDRTLIAAMLASLIATAALGSSRSVR
jgi:hypothetical protein